MPKKHSKLLAFTLWGCLPEDNTSALLIIRYVNISMNVLELPWNSENRSTSFYSLDLTISIDYYTLIEEVTI